MLIVGVLEITGYVHSHQKYCLSYRPSVHETETQIHLKYKIQIQGV